MTTSEELPPVPPIPEALAMQVLGLLVTNMGAVCSCAQSLLCEIRHVDFDHPAARKVAVDSLEMLIEKTGHLAEEKLGQTREQLKARVRLFEKACAFFDEAKGDMDILMKVAPKEDNSGPHEADKTPPAEHSVPQTSPEQSEATT